MNIGQTIERAIDDAGLTKAEVARLMEITPQAVSGWVSTGTISKQNLVKLSQIVKRDLASLITGEKPEAGLRVEESKPLFSRATPQLSVPVVGLVVASPQGDGYFTDGDYPVGHADAYVSWPTTDSNAYAVRVRGDSMQPRVRPGEVIVVEPNRTPTNGDDVVIRCRDGRKMVKQLLWRRDGEITLGSINTAHTKLTISEIDVESIHFIAAIIQRPTTTDK